MAINVIGVAGSMDVEEWSRLARRMAGSDDGTGMVVAVAPALGLPRGVTVTPGDRYQAGTLFVMNALEGRGLPANNSGSPMIVAICAQVDWTGTTEVSAGSLALIPGTPGANPVPPGLTQNPGVLWQTPLAYARIEPGASTVASLTTLPPTSKWGDAKTLNGKPEGSLYVGTAAGAVSAEKVANDNTYMRFHWVGQGYQPDWVWGGSNSDPANMYVFSPANFRVLYAATAGSAASAGSATNATNAAGIINQFADAYATSGQYNFTRNSDPIYLSGSGLAGTGATMVRDSTSGRVGFQASSRDVKTAIVDMPISVAALRSLRPVFFEYDNALDTVDDHHGTQGGFIAEEVQDHFPQAVLKDGDGKVVDILERSLLAGAYRLIGDLYAKVEALEARLGPA